MRKACTDFQRTKAYRWEDPIHEADKVVPFADLQTLVDYVWAGEGLAFPPKIAAMPKQARRRIADASRYTIRVPEEGLKTTILLHELAHSLCPGHAHGPRWVGMYMRLLEKYARHDMLRLMYLAKLGGVKFDLSGQDIMGAHHAR